MPAQKTAEGTPSDSWGAWYSWARDEMAFRFGMRRIAKDRYKEQYALGKTPQQAAKSIYMEMQARGQL